jgi:UDP-N-acetylmuramoyl-L-alanyl-D-glutamate--2,6-diaminopimelate ligase
MENYYQAKRMLFDVCDYAVINTDDEYGRRLFDEITCKKDSYSCCGRGDFYADAIKLRADGTSFWLCCGEKSYQLSLLMTGTFNVANVTAAIAAGLRAGLTMEQMMDALEGYTGVRGRCEIIPTGKDFTVICDYAHTPDAIENILSSVKEYTTGRLMCLFGCGGNRDRTKRPKMAAAAAKYADMLIVTSDNPRDEAPGEIIEEILTGLEGKDIPYVVEEDRSEAIFKGMKLAQPGDVLVLAGKGHEDYQILAGGVHVHMDEREIVKESLSRLDAEK